MTYSSLKAPTITSSANLTPRQAMSSNNSSKIATVSIKVHRSISDRFWARVRALSVWVRWNTWGLSKHVKWSTWYRKGVPRFVSNYQVGTRKLASRQGAVSNHTSLTHHHLSPSFFACSILSSSLVLSTLLQSLRLHVMASQLKKYKKDVHQMSTKLQGVYNDLQEEQSHRMVDDCLI